MSAEDVAQLVLRERQSRDRGWYEEMAACFAADSVVKMSWFSGSGADFVRATRDMVGRGDLAVHRLSSPTVRIDQDRALVELPLVIERRIDVDGSRLTLLPPAARSTGPSTALTGSGASCGSRRSTRRTPSPRSCPTPAWTSTRRSWQVGDDRLGDDRPEAVQAQYREEMTWLHEIRTPATTTGGRKDRCA